MVKSKFAGFTLVELIVVILLIAIVSLYAVSRYSGTSGFSPFVAQEQVISVIRQVQVNRMQSNIDIDAVVGNSNFSLRLLNDCIGSQAACADQNQSRSDWVVIAGVTFTSNVGNLVNFDLLGNPDGVATPVNIEMRSTDGTCAGVEINAIGYVSPRGC
ncbi:type II secretion system protein [Vibrio sp. M250220]|uniref:type II secretion system protein n=1 Tax=Vibrio sp. M250220 TaxID=3020894 RepID=UPI002F3F5BDE